MTKMIEESLHALIEEIVKEVITEEVPMVFETIGPDSFMTPGDDHMVSTLKKAKQKLRDTSMTPQQASHEEAQIDVLINKLLTKRKGRATLNRSDMEKLDKWTRWMTFLPFGHAYRRGLAKYLRSKNDKIRHDPFKDFRKYSYDQHNMPFGESTDWADMDPEANTPASAAVIMGEDDQPKDASHLHQNTHTVYYHGTSHDFKPGSLILPPSKTNKVSEKGRKKNLDVVFFTKDPRSALIYAGRAVHSLGGHPAVYEVEPQGPISVLNNTEGTTVFYAPYAKVIRKVKLK